MASKDLHQTVKPIDVTGEITGESFKGIFTFKTRLSHRERLQIDQIRRQLLGPQPDGAVPTARAISSAQIFANLQVRVLKAPSWWTNSDNGIDLADDDVPAAVYDAALAAEQEAIEAVTKKAEDAKKDLESSVEENA